ncbi:MAG TPA: hypothetical protein K8V54_05670 [Corynebacterium kroppenstedtii]|nr:hypothetical protein [Corynebacterium kroppenstedtii]
MSNLGDYQRIVTFIKSLGGPEAAKKYAAAVAGGIFVAGGFAFVGAQKGVDKVRSRLVKRSEQCASIGQTFTIHTDAVDDSGLKFRAGGKLTVLECDATAILIEILGDTENPYFVSSEFLALISDYPVGCTTEDK